MQAKYKGPNPKKIRKMRQTGLRIYVDQLEALAQLCATKYRGMRTQADLIRQAVEDFLDKEKRG